MKISFRLALAALALLSTPVAPADDEAALREIKTVTYRSSNVLTREAGEWRAVASHVSGFMARGSGEPDDAGRERYRSATRGVASE